MFLSKIKLSLLFFTISLNTALFASIAQTPLCSHASIKEAEIGMKSPIPVAIVGAGLTGLITAYELNKAGIPCVVIEASNRIGGRVETVYYPDQTFAEAHMEEYWDDSVHADLLKELNIPTIKDCAVSSVIIDQKIYSHDQLTGDDYFKHIFNNEEYEAIKQWNDKIWKLNKQLKNAISNNQSIPLELQELMHISFADYVKKEGLPKKVNEWIRVTLEPEISLGWDQLSALDGIDEMSIFLIDPNGKRINNHHVEGGNEKYIQALVKASPQTQILNDSKVTHINQKDDRVEVIFKNAMGVSSKISSLYAVVTVPLFAIQPIQFSPPLSEVYQTAIKTTKFASYIKIQYRVKPTVEAVWSKNHTTDDLFTLLTDDEIGCIYDSTHNDSEEDDQTKEWTITSLIYGKTATEWCKLPSSSILKAANAAIDKILPNFSNHIVSAEVYAYPTAIAYWPVGSRSRFDQLASSLRQPFGRIQIGGDTTENSHSAGAADAAMRMSKQIIEWMK